MEQNHKYISDFKVSTRPADVGEDAFSQRAPGFKENKLLRPLCMPRWKTGLPGNEGTSQRTWCQEGKVTWTSRGNNLDAVEERMPLGFVVFQMKELKQPWPLMQLWALLASPISKRRGRC